MICRTCGHPRSAHDVPVIGCTQPIGPGYRHPTSGAWAVPICDCRKFEPFDAPCHRESESE